MILNQIEIELLNKIISECNLKPYEINAFNSLTQKLNDVLSNSSTEEKSKDLENIEKL